MITIKTITAYLRELDAEVACNSSGEECIFSNGEAVFQCTASARRVVEKFGGRVVGFYSENNPGAEITDGENGHDFAIIADRFVVDYWAACATGVIDQPVFDLTDAEDCAMVLRLYGPNDAWKPLAEK